MMKRILLLIFIILSVKSVNAQRSKIYIPWEIILPESFLDINIKLNENKNLYSKHKISKVTQIIKVSNDTSIYYLNQKGCIYKEYRGFNNESKQSAIKKYKKTKNHVTETTINFGLKEYFYDKNGKVNRIIYSYQFKKCYSYQLHYNKDSLINLVLIFDSTDSFLGRVSLKYKNNFVAKEKGLLNKRKVYTIKHNYTFNKYNGERIEENITFNKVLISESIFWKNKRIVLKKFSNYFYTEFFNLDIGVDYKLNLYKQTNYTNNESIPNLIKLKLFGYNLNSVLNV